MQILGYPMDMRSQIARRRLRFWLTCIFTLYVLVVVDQPDNDPDDFTQNDDFSAQQIDKLQ